MQALTVDDENCRQDLFSCKIYSVVCWDNDLIRGLRVWSEQRRANPDLSSVTSGRVLRVKRTFSFALGLHGGV
jgi:hypothetical protein